MVPLFPLLCYRRCPHGEVAIGAALRRKSEASVKSLSTMVFLAHAQDDRAASIRSFGEESANKLRSHAAPAASRRELDIDQPNFALAAPDHPYADVLCSDHHDGYLRARKTGSIVGAAGLELLSEEGLALDGVPIGAGEFIGARLAVKLQQETVVGRSGGSKPEGEWRMGDGFHGRVVLSLRSAPQFRNRQSASCRHLSPFANRPGGDPHNTNLNPRRNNHV